MGKKGSWFSAIKKVFSPQSKEKLADEPDKKNTKEKKKKRFAKLGHGDTNSFVPLFREPSSIEKILDEAEREHKLIFRPPTPPQQLRTPPSVPQAASPSVPSERVTSPRAASPKVTSPSTASPKGTSASAASPKVASPTAASPRVTSPRAPSPKNVHHHVGISHSPEPILRDRNASATKIQAAYRGYIGRRSFRAVKGLARLQDVVKGQNAKRQTKNAIKYMQMLVRVQSQIQSRRIQMLENQAWQYRNDKEVESTLGKWSLAAEAGNNEDWDDSLLTKEEIEARLQRKVDAIIKRERAIAYAYSHQSGKSSSKSAQSAVADIRSNGIPWWWNWLERQLPLTSTPQNEAVKNFQPTPPRPHSEIKLSPQPSSSNNQRFGFDNVDTTTPRSSKSLAFTPTRQARTPVSRTPQANTSRLSKYSRARASGSESPFDLPLKDDDSLMSCPPFSVPNYMNSTVSAKAKAKANGIDKRRISFPLMQGIDSSKWNKGSPFSVRDSGSQPQHSLSVDSTVSMPATVGRKPFNRFV